MATKEVDYQQLAAATVTNPDSAFRTALEADDLAALAIVSIMVPGPPPATQIANFNAFLARYESNQETSELCLGVIEQAEQISAELLDRARSSLRERLKDLPLNAAQISRAQSVVRNSASDGSLRSLMLLWLWYRSSELALGVATEILQNQTEPHGPVTKQALIVVGRLDPDRTTLWNYARRHLDGAPQTPEHQPDAVLNVVNAIQKPTENDVPTIGELLIAAAQQGLAVGNTSLEGFMKHVSVKQIASLTKQFEDAGQTAWLATQFMPALLSQRAVDIAQTADEPWWPSECRSVFATTSWEQFNDGLYPVVLEKLHQTSDEQAQAEIRQRVAQRCQAASSTDETAMPRIGLRALIELALAGQIATNDSSLIPTLQGTELSVIQEEIAFADWKTPDRARRIGEIVAQLAAGVLPFAVEKSLVNPSETTIALLAGAALSLDREADRLLEVIGDDEPILITLCETSEAVAEKTLARWNGDHSMLAFRALRATKHSEERLTGVSQAVRLYDQLQSAERAELLGDYGEKADRVDILISILTDWAGTSPKPSEEDLITALRFMGQHLASGMPPEGVLESVAVVCREVTRPAVRSAAYDALANASPTSAVVELLKEREAGEAAALQPVAKAALHKIADKLELIAGNAAEPNRAEATQLLSRIEIGRAASYARDLLAADEAAARMLAAEILGAG